MLTAEGFGDQHACADSKGNKYRAPDSGRRATTEPPTGAHLRRCTRWLRPRGSAIAICRRDIAFRVEFLKAPRALARVASWCGALCRSVQLQMIDLCSRIGCAERGYTSWDSRCRGAYHAPSAQAATTTARRMFDRKEASSRQPAPLGKMVFNARSSSGLRTVFYSWLT